MSPALNGYRHSFGDTCRCWEIETDVFQRAGLRMKGLRSFKTTDQVHASLDGCIIFNSSFSTVGIVYLSFLGELLFIRD